MTLCIFDSTTRTFYADGMIKCDNITIDNFGVKIHYHSVHKIGIASAGTVGVCAYLMHELSKYKQKELDFDEFAYTTLTDHQYYSDVIIYSYPESKGYQSISDSSGKKEVQQLIRPIDFIGSLSYRNFSIIKTEITQDPAEIIRISSKYSDGAINNNVQMFNPSLGVEPVWEPSISKTGEETND